MPLIRALVVLLALSSLLATETETTQSGITLTTSPALSAARPSSDPVKISLEIRDGSARPLQSGWLRLRLRAPASHWLFSTDFPRVEGTLLFDMLLPVSRGVVEWEYAFPIRGVYRLEAESVGQGADGIKQSFELPIRENGRKLFYLGLFLAALFFFGFMAGRLFTAPRGRR